MTLMKRVLVAVSLGLAASTALAQAPTHSEGTLRLSPHQNYVRAYGAPE